MALPELVRCEVENELTAYCDRRIPLQMRDEIRLSFGIRGNNLTLQEERPSFRKPEEWTTSPVAQFRYDKDGNWTLYWPDRNGKWHEYIDLDPSKDIQDLLDEVDEDPTGIFWG